MNKIYKITTALVVVSLLTASAYVITPYIINAYETRNWETFTNEDFGFTFKYPKEMQATGGRSPTTKGDVTIYRAGGMSFIEDSYDHGGSIAISIVEGTENLDEQYADREKVRIGGKNWRYYNSGELTNTGRRDSATGELNSEGGLDEEYIWYWKEYITRFSSELRFEVYANYTNTEYSRIMDIMVRSIRFK